MPAQSTTRSDFSERKRSAILRGATEVFLEAGYGAASMDAIAKVAGVSKRTVYGHFESKEALFGEIVRSKCENLRAATLRDDLRSRPLPEVLTDFGHQLVALHLEAEPLALYRIVIAESGRFPALGRAVYASGPGPGLDELADYLRERSAAGELQIDDPRHGAELFAEMVRGHMHMRRLLGVGRKPSRRDVREHVDRCVKFFLRATAPH